MSLSTTPWPRLRRSLTPRTGQRPRQCTRLTDDQKLDKLLLGVKLGRAAYLKVVEYTLRRRLQRRGRRAKRRSIRCMAMHMSDLLDGRPGRRMAKLHPDSEGR